MFLSVYLECKLYLIDNNIMIWKVQKIKIEKFSFLYDTWSFSKYNVSLKKRKYYISFSQLVD